MQQGGTVARRAFGPRFYLKVGLISFVAGGILEYAMIQSGFYEAVVTTSKAQDWQKAMNEVRSEVRRQLKEKQERGELDAERALRLLDHAEAQAKADRQQHLKEQGGHKEEAEAK